MWPTVGAKELAVTALEPAGNFPAAQTGGSGDVIRQMVAAWLLAQESQHTKIAYARDLMSTAPRMKVPGWLHWCAERELDPLTVRRAHVDAYKHVLQQADYSPNSIARRLAVVSSWYDYLLDEEVIDHNPAKAVKRPRINQSISPAVGLSEDELDLLLDAAEADGKRSAALIAVLFYAGLRVGSVVNANVGDLGWNEGERTISLTVKGGSIETRYIEDIAAEALDAYLAERGRPAKSEPLFLNVSGFRIDQAYAWRLIRSLARRSGIKSWDRLGPHSLRHTMATHAFDHGVPLVDVQDALGHRDPKTTRRYDRARNRRDKRPGRVLAERRRQKVAESLRDAEPLPQEASET
jgi:integrase/recombinase XerD